MNAEFFAALEQLEKEAREDAVPIVRREMQSFLKLLMAAARPKRILEVGTAVGFSALLMCEYNPEPCQIITIENYEKRLKAIEEGDAFLKAYYKLLNNSFYGKLAERAHETYFENVIKEDGTIDSEVRSCEKRPGKYSYVPVASCITAYRRCALVEDALRLSPSGDSVLYMDTDSLFYLDNEETKEGIKSLKI